MRIRLISLRKFHRWIGIIVAAYVVMATLSGLMHIIMSNFFTAPPPVMPEGLVNLQSASLPLKDIVKHIPQGAEVKAINLRTIDGDLWYQVITGDNKPPVYINAATGKVDGELDEVYAQQIAQSYLHRTDGVYSSAYLAHFDNEYLNIFRALPVYKFEAEGDKGERVYVSTITGSVTLYLNNARAFGQNMFSYLHKLAFMSNHAVRDILMTFLVLGILSSTVMGLWLFFRTRR